jgi:hypothetical protein
MTNFEKSTLMHRPFQIHPDPPFPAEKLCLRTVKAAPDMGPLFSVICLFSAYAAGLLIQISREL